MIKLKCKHCKYQYEITEAELIEDGEIHKFCFICGGEIEILNLLEIVEKDLYKRAEEYIDKWVAEIGWDNTLDLIKRNKNNPTYRIYKEILDKKGFNLGGENK